MFKLKTSFWPLVLLFYLSLKKRWVVINLIWYKEDILPTVQKNCCVLAVYLNEECIVTSWNSKLLNMRSRFLFENTTLALHPLSFSICELVERSFCISWALTSFLCLLLISLCPVSLSVLCPLNPALPDRRPLPLGLGLQGFSTHFPLYYCHCPWPGKHCWVFSCKVFEKL